MKQFYCTILFFVSFISVAATEIYYQHPLPNSRYHSPATTIILRFESDPPVQAEDIEYIVTGSSSGLHNGHAYMSSDGRTIIWKSDKKFSSGESVLAVLNIASRSFDDSFIFHISGAATLAKPELVEEQVFSQPDDSIRMINGVVLPSDFPELLITQTDSTDSGYIFINSENYSMILHNDGTPIFYRKSTGSRLWDFTVQNDSILSLVEGATAKTFNQCYEPLQQYKGGHGYKTDHHEFLLSPEGHALLIMEDIQNIDLSTAVEGGKIAKVVGNHIQELDKEKNVIFEWRSWDHYNITDADVGLTSSTIHAFHLNSIDIDYDGHLLVSARHQNEVTKINRHTGKVIWRLGGKNSTIEFESEADQFSYQHDFKAIPDKHQHYTVFDNGNKHSPTYSRAMEFYIDTMNNKAVKVWQYRHIPDRYSNWMGSVQRLSNQNTGMCWAYKNLPKYSEISSSGEIIYEMDFAKKTTCYRAHRHVWHGQAKAPYLQAEPGTQYVRLIYNQFGKNNIQYYNVYADTLTEPETVIAGSSEPFIHLSQLSNQKTWYFRVTSVDSNGVESDFSNELSVFVQLLKPDENQIKNGDFSDGIENWTLYHDFESEIDWDITDSGELAFFVYETSGYATDAQLSQGELMLQQGKMYKLEFDAYADSVRPLEVQLLNDRGLVNYSKFSVKQLSTRSKHFSMTFPMQDESDFSARLYFNNGYAVGEVILDNIYLAEYKETAVQKTEHKPSTKFTLLDNYPNPFNASTTIQYNLAQAGQVELSIYNILGEMVHHKNFRKTAGVHKFIWMADQQSSGLYFCIIRVTPLNSNNIFSKKIKMMLIK